MSERLEILQFDGQPAQRLDKFLTANLPDYSRTRLQALIKAGMVTIDGNPVLKASQVLDKPVQVQVQIPPLVLGVLEAESIPLDIIFENQDLLVVNKPAGMVVHPAAGHFSGTLVNAALSHAPQMEGIGGEQRPGVVHRLDKETSGLILLAKNDRAHRWLQDQFRLRKVEKIYLALVDGCPPTPTGRVEAPIGRHPQHRKQMAIVQLAKGRDATSEYRTLQTFPLHTLLEVHPITGRTHQIRLHMALLGCPISGDVIYGRRVPSLQIKRHFLHAYRLTVNLPGESQSRTFVAPLPPELEQILTELNK